MSKFELVGIREEPEYGYGGYTGKVDYIEEIVATFDTERQARAYEKAARLRKPSRNVGKYRRTSLLAYYSDYEIREHEEEIPPPHNPNLSNRR